MRFSSSICLAACLLFASSTRGKLEPVAELAPQVEIASDPTFIYDGEELAKSLRDAYALGESAEALQSVQDAVVYLVSEREGNAASKMIAGAYDSLNASGDTSIANDLSVAFRSAIENLFTDPEITVVTSSVALAVAPAVASKISAISQTTMTALENVASGEYCPEAGVVLVKAKLESERIQNDKAFTAALKNYQDASVNDAKAANLVWCAAEAFDLLGL